MINPHCREEVIHKGSLIGWASVVIPKTQVEGVGALGGESLTQKERSYRRSFLIEKLRLKENPKLRNDPKLMEKVLGAFEDNWEAVSTGATPRLFGAKSSSSRVRKNWSASEPGR